MELWDYFYGGVSASQYQDKNFMKYADIAISKAFWHTLFPGSCSGGYDMGGGLAVDKDTLKTACIAQSQCVDASGNPCQFYGPEVAVRKLGDDHARRLATAEAIEDESERIRETDRANRFTQSTFHEKHTKRELAPPGASDFAFLNGVLEEFCTAYTTGKEFSELGIKFDMLQGNAWASLLLKSVNGLTESVASFQGTKAADHSMMYYNLHQDPVFITLGSEYAIITEGHFDYVSNLIECVYDMVYTSWYDIGYEPTFITGHSLGGAAATLFIKSDPCWLDPSYASWCSSYDISGYGYYDTYPRLVTFGSPPTMYMGGWTEGRIACLNDDGRYGYSGDIDYSVTEALCSGGYMTQSGFSAFVSKTGGSISNTCSGMNPGGVRFWHKFDPVPSVALVKGQYGHNVENSFSLYDIYGDDCFDNTACEIISAAGTKEEVGFQANGVWVDPWMITNFLCDGWEIKPQSHYSPCWRAEASYMSMFNAWPCGQNTVMRLFQSMDDGYLDWHFGDVHIGTLQYTLFNEFEGMGLCVDSWLAAIDAYLQSAIVAFPMFMGTAFTFTWIHSTYGFYPLCLNFDAFGNVAGWEDERSLSLYKGAASNCAYVTTCESYCMGGAYALNPEAAYCMEDCMEDLCSTMESEYAVSTR
jgi:hypothetical protein